MVASWSSNPESESWAVLRKHAFGSVANSVAWPWATGPLRDGMPHQMGHAGGVW